MRQSLAHRVRMSSKERAGKPQGPREGTSKPQAAPLTREAISPSWMFLADCIDDSHEPGCTTNLPEALPVRGMERVMRAIHPRTSAQEVQWIFSNGSDEDVSFDHVFSLVKTRLDPDFDPVVEAFRLLCKETNRGTYVDMAKVCEIYQKLGIVGVDAGFLQEVVEDLLVDSDVDRRGKRRIDINAFRKLSVFAPEEEKAPGNEEGGFMRMFNPGA